MNINNIRAVDHARAAAIAMAVLSNDDAMLTQAFAEARDDKHPSAVSFMIVAGAKNLVDTLTEVIGADETEQLLQRTLVQLRAAAEDGS